MDPISIIVTSLVAGAVGGLKTTAELAVRDAYAGIKKLIQRKYGTVSLQALEQKPDSAAKRASIAEDLVGLGAGNDKELLNQAILLLDAIKLHDPDVAAKLNINLEEVDATYFKLSGAAAAGDINVGIKKSKFDGGINLEGLTAGSPARKK
jgi:hypothetical protein